MSNEVAVLKTFSNEIEAGIAQQILRENGVLVFMFKDDAGAWSHIFSKQVAFACWWVLLHLVFRRIASGIVTALKEFLEAIQNRERSDRTTFALSAH